MENKKSQETNQQTQSSASAQKQSPSASLQKYGIDINNKEYNMVALFNQSAIDNTDECIKRLKCILRIYSLWIQIKKRNKNNINIDIGDIINNELSKYYNFSHCLNDFKHVLDNKHLLGFDNGDMDNKSDDLCDINSCFVIERHERDKAYYSRHYKQRNAFYFINDNKNIDANDANRSIAHQQCLDSVHCYIYHTMRIDLNKLVNNKSINENNNMDEKNFDNYVLCKDYMAHQLTKTIKTIRCNSTRCRVTRRTTSNFSKFITTNNYINAGSILFDADEKKEAAAETDTDDVIICFMDGLNDEMVKYNINLKIVNKLHNFLMNDEYDTDSFILDYKNNTNESEIQDIIRFVVLENGGDYKLQSLINLIFSEHLSLYENIENEYSASFRFFYWLFYKNNTNKYNVVYTASNGTNVIEQNVGYLICDWYVGAVYDSFKSELLNNKTAPFSISDWMETKKKAEIKYNTWRKNDKTRKLQCKYSYWQRVYGIKPYDVITISHLMSLLFYTNFSVQQYEFSATFRRIYWNESDYSLKKRHSQFAIWAKLLRETIECFGIEMSESPEKIFYHGISTEMLFRSTTFNIYGPLSTTPEFEIAHGTFAKTDGMVIDIWNSKMGNFLWNCQFWSDYTEENERFFIGTLQALKFLSIHHIKVKQDYYAFIKPMSMLAQMLRGSKYKIRIIKSVDVSCLSMLILNFVSRNISGFSLSNIPPYIDTFFANFVNNIHQIQINMYDMNRLENEKKTAFGYLLFKPLFFIDENTINFTKIIKIFTRKLQSITIYNRKKGEWLKSVELNDVFIKETISVIKIINESATLKHIFKEIVIVNPQDSITEFIDNFQSVFMQNGWKLQQISYNHPKKSKSSNCANSLALEPL